MASEGNREPVDREVEAMAILLETLRHFDASTRERMLGWVNDRLSADELSAKDGRL